MTDLKLAAQKALEAMVTARDYVNAEYVSRSNLYAAYPHRWASEREDLAQLDTTIAALRSALQHQEEREPVVDNEETHPNNRLLFRDMCRFFGIKLGEDRIWEARERIYAATPPLLQKEEGARILNALDVLNRMGLGPQDTAPAETFLRILGERGMWVIDAAIATRQGEKPE